MRPILAAFALVAVAACQTTTSAPAPATLPSQAAAPQMAFADAGVSPRQIGGLLNLVRSQNGLPMLSEHPRLSAAAQAHAEWIARTGNYSHTGQGGSTPKQRAQAAGYKPCLVAENIAWGQRTASRVMDGWQASPAHRTNNLRDRLDHYGVGVSGQHYVLMFGRPC